MVALCWGKIYFLPRAPRARVAMFFYSSLLFCWLSDKWKRLTHPDFTAAVRPPGVDRKPTFSFLDDDDGDLFVNKRAGE